jgi:hypothetical protein
MIIQNKYKLFLSNDLAKRISNLRIKEGFGTKENNAFFVILLNLGLKYYGRRK